MEKVYTDEIDGYELFQSSLQVHLTTGPEKQQKTPQMWNEWLNTLLKSSQVREKATTTKQSCHNQHRARFYEQNCMW